jgi:hypothetical protein
MRHRRRPIIVLAILGILLLFAAILDAVYRHYMNSLSARTLASSEIVAMPYATSSMRTGVKDPSFSSFTVRAAATIKVGSWPRPSAVGASASSRLRDSAIGIQSLSHPLEHSNESIIVSRITPFLRRRDGHERVARKPPLADKLP